MLTEEVGLLLDGVAGLQHHRHGKAAQQGHVAGECAEGALRAHDAEDDAGADVEHQENQEGQERKPAEIFLFVCHNHSPSFQSVLFSVV